MNGWTHSTVTRELTLRLKVSPYHHPAVRAVLHYDVTDPYAVHATFWTEDHPPVTWVFARDLLITGATTSAGSGDVQVWASLLGGVETVFVELRTPQGRALMYIAAGEIRDFLSTTYMLCVPGDEDDHLDTELAIQNLLAS